MFDLLPSIRKKQELLLVSLDFIMKLEKEIMMRIFKKKKQEIEYKYVYRLEEGFFEHFDLYYDMYSNYLLQQEFSKIDNVASSLLKVYDRELRIVAFYDKQLSFAKTIEEENFLNSSKQYVIFGTSLLHKLLKSCKDEKVKWKENSNSSISQIENTIAIYNQEKERFYGLKKQRDKTLQLLKAV